MEYNEELSQKLIQISFDRYNNNLDKEHSFLEAQKLLTNGANPDFRESLHNPTALMLAIYHEDKKYAQLFINHGADPEQRAPYPGKEGHITALEMERTGWLKKMVDERKPQTSKKRNYNY
jgi:ankyrin repeat protein